MTTAAGVQKLVLDQVAMEQVGAGMQRRLVCGQQMMMARIKYQALAVVVVVVLLLATR